MTDDAHTADSPEAKARSIRRSPRSARSARKLLRTITWTGATISTIAFLGGIAGLATVETLGPLPDNDWAGVGLSLFIGSLLIPFVTWLIHLAINVWTDETENWSVARYGTGATVLASAAYGMLAASLLALALTPLIVALFPQLGSGDWTFFPVTIVGLMLGSITVAAIAGGIAVMGRPGIIVGIILGFGFAATAYGIYTETHPWTWAGITALALSTAGFLLARQLRQRI